jgi:hypothetical protein
MSRELAEEIVDKILICLSERSGPIGGWLEAVSNEVYDSIEEELIGIVENELLGKNGRK